MKTNQESEKLLVIVNMRKIKDKEKERMIKRELC